MRTYLLLAFLSSSFGCAQILADANGHRARVEVTSDGFTKIEFAYTDLVEKDQIGGCKLLDQSDFRLPDPHPNSGDVTIAASTAPVIAPVLHRGLYRENDRRKEPVWKPGDTIVVSAPGHTAPPFHIELPAPLPIEPISPPAQDPSLRGPAIWALRDFPLTWVPTPNATLVVQLIEIYPAAGSDRAALREGNRRIRCEFDAKQGAAVIPQALIAEMPVGNALLFISSMQERIVDVSGWEIRVRAYADAVREPNAHIDARAPKGPNGEE